MNSVKIARDSHGYHHGDLRRHLIATAEAVIGERGVDGFTLREAARRAGVSPAAPAHHFGDARGLLTAVALLGFEDFTAALQAADVRGGHDPMRRLAEQARAYIRFALEHPARFQLMFRDSKHDVGAVDGARVPGAAYVVLENAVRDAAGAVPGAPLTTSQQGMLTALWSMVHGFAHLALGGQLGVDGTAHLLDEVLPPAVAFLLAPLTAR